MDAGHLFEFMGTLGSLIMCASSLPQIIKTYKMKHASGLSGAYLAILLIGMSLILIYALWVRDRVFIFSNCLSLLLTGILAGMWIRYRRGPVEGLTQKNDAVPPPDQ